MLLSRCDLIDIVCVVWVIVLAFFIIITLEIMLLVGIVFPILIWILVKKERHRILE